jgi:tetratricopeptide (TPR) repeat protein
MPKRKYGILRAKLPDREAVWQMDGGFKPMRILTAVSALAVLGLVVLAGEARAVVIVVGGGAGAQCYSTAEFGDPFQAFDICSKALTDQEMSVRDRGATYINRSVVRLRVHDYSGAIADCDLALQRVPTIGEAYVNRGAALLNLDRAQDALVDLNKAITLGLDKVHLAYYNRGLTKEKLNDTRGAYEDYKKALELNPTFTLAADQLKRFTITGQMMTPSRS